MALACGREIRVRGIVQGVGFRPWVSRLAREHGIVGRVLNDALGVTIEAFGSTPALNSFVGSLEKEPPPAAEIAALEWKPIEALAPLGFEIAPSLAAAERRLAIPPEIATCDQCLAEIFDPSNRRYRYAFTNCTNCGPRFTIVRDVPYDRPATSMAVFPMCPACRQEYTTVTDRRFHAQPNACPVCGPRLRLLDAGAVQIHSDDPIRDAAQLIARGLVVAAKGLGGFHLVCDATSEAAVLRLRERKRREAKPLAVMVAGLPQAERIAILDERTRRLLTSPQHPIVLAPRRDGCELAQNIAPDNPLLGVLLPYAPLHHLLLDECARPLVMTSGNVTDEPIAYRNDEACARLGGIADAFLLHDREIVTRCDDSVVRVIAGAPTVLRRSRGYVPRPVLLQRRFDKPVLACGAQLKNTFCLAVNDQAFLGPHIGDLDNLEAFASFEESIVLMQRLLAVDPQIVAHDLHPDYLSTRYAKGRDGVVRIGVQHHHAHVASVMAEHDLKAPVLGVAFDGAGYGTDGASWGGELLLAEYTGFERIATLRPLALAGGDAAIRQVWRIGVAAVMDAYDGAPPRDVLARLRDVPEHALETVMTMIAKRFNSPLAHGAGRYFDAMAALALGIRHARYEGEAAMLLEHAHDGNVTSRFSYRIDEAAEPWQIDLRPAFREAVEALVAGHQPGELSSRFHNTLAHATAKVVRAAAERTGCRSVALTGGCFQNDRLASALLGLLSPSLDVYLPRNVPPGDGGIALGQAVVAAALSDGFGG
ncbi:MAG: carbamoyltransferase HypF [Vulcanimicrobiaceae bacterium]